jgi:hypothetical protein
MSGPYVINDPGLLLSLVDKDAVVESPAFGVQCVALVKMYTINDKGEKCARSKDWSPGTSVKDAVDAGTIERGTAVATFNKDGKYLSMATGNHACLFVEAQKDGSGFLVLEQHVDPFPNKIQNRVLKYTGKPDNGAIQMGNGDCYSIIL